MTDENRIKQALAVLFSAFPTQDRDAPDITVAAYMMALDGLSADAIVEAVKAFVSGRVKRANHAFLPSTAELAVETRQQDERLQRMRPEPPRALEPPPCPESAAKELQMRQRVGAMMRGLASRLKSSEAV